ncbi:MAG: hypothetical protein ACJ8NS_04145 [Chthoniobacterales bacterium]
MVKRILRLFGAALLFLLVSNIIQASSSPGIVEGQVRIVLSKGGAHLADDTSVNKEKIPYADYPVLILSKDRKTEVAQVTPDGNGRFRTNLPAGDYVLDVKRNARHRLRVTASPFTVVDGQTVQVEMEIESAVEPM